MKVVGLDFEVERVKHAEEHIFVEKKDKVVEIEDIEDIEGTFHKYFSNLVTKVVPKISKELGQSKYFVMIVKMVEG